MFVIKLSLYDASKDLYLTLKYPQVAHLMRAVNNNQGNVNNNTARQMAELLSSLPLPEDYALQELRSLTRSYMMEIA